MTTTPEALHDVRAARRPGADAAKARPPVAAHPQVARYLGLAAALEWELRDALILAAERHERNDGISRGLTTLATWSADHLDWLREPVVRYGMVDQEGPARLRAALLTGTRTGTSGELADIVDLAALVQQASMAWTILVQGAKELHDEALVELASAAREHSRRQLAWLRTQVEHEAPDAVAAAPDPGDQVARSLPKRMTSIEAPARPSRSRRARNRAVAAAGTRSGRGIGGPSGRGPAAEAQEDRQGGPAQHDPADG